MFKKLFKELLALREDMTDHIYKSWVVVLDYLEIIYIGERSMIIEGQ